jgi:hypothetical protein
MSMTILVDDLTRCVISQRVISYVIWNMSHDLKHTQFPSVPTQSHFSAFYLRFSPMVLKSGSFLEESFHSDRANAALEGSKAHPYP